MGEAKEVVNDTLQMCQSKNINDWSKMKNEIRDSLGNFLWRKTKRRPMVLPIIMEVD